MKWIAIGNLHINVQNIAYFDYKDDKDSGSKKLAIAFNNGLILKKEGTEASIIFKNLQNAIPKAPL
jgi:hypothetical protein